MSLVQPSKIIATEFPPDLLGNSWLAKAVDAKGKTLIDPMSNKRPLQAWGSTQDRAVRSLFSQFSLRSSPVLSKPLFK